MGLDAIFDAENWRVPFHFWSGVFFALGCIVGSFLNVCIYRMPLDLSVIRPPSHCPHCRHAIPWYLNVPLVTWLVLRGRCAHCGAPISFRYFLVELLTGGLFLGSWLAVGRESPAVAAVYCLVLAGLVVATFIDFEHFIIPDEITLGGMVAGVLCSIAVPALHQTDQLAAALVKSVLGLAAGFGIVYFILRLGKLLFGKHKIALEPGTRIVFTETALVLPDEEIPYEELFFRKSDTIAFRAATLELPDHCRSGVEVRLRPELLCVGDDEYDPETVPHMEAVTDNLILPREAMGFGDVKFMGAIGAFLGWQAAVFSLLMSSVIGALVGGTLILLRKREWSSRIPYGPYIALAAVIWMFGGWRLLDWWLSGGVMYRM